MPFWTFFFFWFNLANLGFPLTINFASEMLIFIGLFDIMPSVALLSLVGVLMSGIYSFILITRVCYGPNSTYINSFYDLTRRETYILALMLIPVITFGFFPSMLTQIWSMYILVWLL